MIRRVLEQRYHSIDHERLITVTVFEEGTKKQDVKAINSFSKRHFTLVSRGKSYEYKD